MQGLDGIQCLLGLAWGSSTWRFSICLGAFDYFFLVVCNVDFCCLLMRNEEGRAILEPGVEIPFHASLIVNTKSLMSINFLIPIK